MRIVDCQSSCHFVIIRRRKPINLTLPTAEAPSFFLRAKVLSFDDLEKVSHSTTAFRFFSNVSRRIVISRRYFLMNYLKKRWG
jgi:hypothetical protein